MKTAHGPPNYDLAAKIGIRALIKTNFFFLLRMADQEDWAIDSNEALQLTLLGPLSSNPLTFHPDFTYPIFGEAETIYGYKGLAINLSLASWDFRGYLKVTWDQKINPSLGIEAEDVVEMLKELLPEGNILLWSLLIRDLFYDENDFQLYIA